MRWGRIVLHLGIVVILMAGLAAAAVAGGAGPLWTGGLVLGCGVLATLLAVASLLRPWRRFASALNDGVEGLRAGDLTLRLAVPDEPVIADLVEVYNALGDALAQERGNLRQRELLITGALEVSPAAVILVGDGGRILYGNRAARVLLRGGRRLEGHDWRTTVGELPPALRGLLERHEEGLATVALDEGEETFQVAQRGFELNSRRQTLVMLRRLTAELRRQEIQGWKTAIRMVGHEARTQLAAIRSLVRSARSLSERGELARSAELLGDVDQAGEALQRFIDGYGRFARLPEPRREAVELRGFLVHLARLHPFRIVGEIPGVVLDVDPGQLQQVLINLLKNSAEAGSAAEDIKVAVQSERDALSIEVRDRGCGMREEELTRALLPFRSSKPGGAGLGLALCREVMDAHGGGLSLRSRPGGGLIATCRLPLADPTPPEEISG